MDRSAQLLFGLKDKFESLPISLGSCRARCTSFGTLGELVIQLSFVQRQTSLRIRSGVRPL